MYGLNAEPTVGNPAVVPMTPIGSGSDGKDGSEPKLAFVSKPSGPDAFAAAAAALTAAAAAAETVLLAVVNDGDKMVGGATSVEDIGERIGGTEVEVAEDEVTTGKDGKVAPDAAVAGTVVVAVAGTVVVTLVVVIVLVVGLDVVSSVAVAEVGAEFDPLVGGIEPGRTPVAVLIESGEENESGEWIVSSLFEWRDGMKESELV